MLSRFIFFALSVLIPLSAYAGEPEDIQQLLKSKQFPQALERADKFIAANPKDAQVRFLKGIIQTEMGQANDAIKTFSALAIDYPQLPEPYNNLAVLYAQQNQLDKARAALSMAIQTNPSYAIAHENLGDLYARLASQAYDKALQLGNDGSAIQTKLTLVHELFSKSPSTAAIAKPAKPEPGSKAATIAPQPVIAQVKPVPVKASPVLVAAAPPATQPSKPAATPTPATPAVSGRDADQQKIMSVVNAWADAWSKQNVDAYLGSYSHSFHTPNRQKYADWASERKERVSSPKSINVTLSKIPD